MTSPLPLPDWVPWWVHVAAMLLILFFGTMFLFMPFSVFGVKGRLEAVEARLDEIQAEIRILSLRLPESIAEDVDEGPRGPRLRPPIPPTVVPARTTPERARTEPRLY